MFASLSQLASRSFVVAFVLPVLIGLVLTYVLFADIHPVSELDGYLKGDASFDTVAYLAAAVWCMSLLLSMSSTFQYRLLEGYLWPVSAFGLWREKQSEAFKRGHADAEETKKAVRRANGGEKARFAALLTRSYYRLALEFPEHEGAVMPTRFGNRIRAFEEYSTRIYGADAVALWFRLQAVIPRDYSQAIENSRANLDFLVNMIFLMSALFIAVLVRIVHLLSQRDWVISVQFVSDFSGLFLSAAILAATARAAYLFSLNVISPWGDLVKGAFDNYLPALARQWGYDVPRDLTDRRQFWKEVSHQMVFHIPMDPARWPAPATEKDSSAVPDPPAPDTPT